MKKICFSMIVTLLTIITAVSLTLSAAAYTTPPNVNRNQVEAKINKLSSIVVGKYFTVSGKAGSSDNNAVINTSWFEKLFPSFGIPSTGDMNDAISKHYYPEDKETYASGRPKGKECHGFATWAEWYIFAEKNTDKVELKYVVTSKEVPSAKFNYETFKTYAMPGDLVRVDGHSFIVISFDSVGVQVLDCNINFKSDINNHKLRWDRVGKINGKDIIWAEKGIAISRATNYDVSTTVEPSAPSEPIITVNEKWIVDKGTTNLRIRSGPSTSYEQVGLVTFKDTVTVTKKQGNWGYITYNGVSGWISLDYCTKVTSHTTTTTKTQYRYYHYTDGTQYSVCAYYGKNKYGGTWKREDTGWLDAPLKMVSNSATSYTHVQQGSACINAGCTDASWEGGKYQDANGIPWYREETRTVTVEAEHTHTYNSGTVTKQPTCTNTGNKKYTCTSCGAEKNETIAKLGHSYDGGTVTKQATCGANGTKTYTCMTCGTTKTETISKEGAHSYNSGVVTKAATCEKSGTMTYTCTVCSATKTETIAKLGHSYDGGTVTKQATCGANGTKTYTCTTCGTTKTETISKEGAHSYNSGVVTKAATCEKSGTMTYTCTVCSATKTETIAKLEHNYIEVSAEIEPTCTSAGKTAVLECTNCHDTSGGRSIAKLNHDYSDEYTVDVEPTCTQKGSKSKYCILCGAKGQTVSIAKSEHIYGDWEITTVPQPGKSGSKQCVCMVCGYKKTSNVPAITKKSNDKRIIMTIGCTDATVFGKAAKNDVPPMIVKSRTMLPARFVAENLGATVEWDGSARKVTIKAEGIVIEMFIDKTEAYVNGNAVTLDSAPFIKGNRTYTPVRFIAENLGATVEWNGDNKQAIITKK